MTDETTYPNPQEGTEPPATAAGGDCDDALRDLYGFLDGEIDDDRRALISRHIDDCGPCLEAFDFEHELRDLVARTCRSEAPDSLKERVADAIRTCDDESGEPGHGVDPSA